MRTLLLGLAVGAAATYLVLTFALPAEDDGARTIRLDEGARRSAADDRDDGELARLRARIEELQARLAAAGAPDAPAEVGGVAIPRTEAGILQLFEEFQRTDDLDQFLALVRALLLQGEAGYPRLTQVLMRVVGKGMAGRWQEEDFLQRVVPALRLATDHEEELVGYVGYLLNAKHVPELMRTGAMGAAMFLAVNGVKGSDRFTGKLLERFVEQTGQGTGAGLGGDSGSMLILAMGMLKQGEAVDPLLAVLRNPDLASNHNEAVQALGRIGDPRAVGTLLKRLRDPERGNSWYYPELEALGRIGTSEATAAAEQHLRNVTDTGKFFVQAGSYIGLQPSPRVIGMMRDKFRENPASNNLWSAAYGLRRAGTPEAVGLLREIAENATHEHLRNTAQRFLEERKEAQDAMAAVEAER